MSIEQNEMVSRPQSKYPNDPDQTRWISEAKKGDRAAFCRLVEKYQRPVYNLCYQMLGDGHEAEDATQEVFVRAFVKLATYDDQRQFSTWLFSIASHYCIDRWKKRRLRFVSWDDLAPWQQVLAEHHSQPEQAILTRETSEQVRHLLKRLQVDDRAVIILRYWYAMSYQEIAKTLDLSPSAVKSRLFRARQKMAQATRRQPGVPTVPKKSSAATKPAEAEQSALLLSLAFG